MSGKKKETNFTVAEPRTDARGCSVVDVAIHVKPDIFRVLVDKIHETITALPAEKQAAVQVRLHFPKEITGLWSDGKGVPFHEEVCREVFSIAYGRDAANVYESPDNLLSVELLFASNGYLLVRAVAGRYVFPGTPMDRLTTSMASAVRGVIDNVVPGEPCDNVLLRHCAGCLGKLFTGPRNPHRINTAHTIISVEGCSERMSDRLDKFPIYEDPEDTAIPEGEWVFLPAKALENRPVLLTPPVLAGVRKFLRASSYVKNIVDTEEHWLVY